jgi:hypothetical protein
LELQSKFLISARSICPFWTSVKYSAKTRFHLLHRASHRCRLSCQTPGDVFSQTSMPRPRLRTTLRLAL